MNVQIGKTIAIFALLACLGSPAAAAVISFSGTFTHDDDVALRGFQQARASAVTFRTYSYAGGTNSLGQVIPAGGFDPVLAVFNATTGALVAIGDDGSPTVDPVTGAALDVLLTVSALPVGNYIVALSQFDNFAIGPNLLDGFLETGNPAFTSVFCSGPPTLFCDATGARRNGNWEVQISGTGVVPEPMTLLLVGLGLVGLAALRWRKK